MAGSVCVDIYTYKHKSDCTETVYELTSLPNNTAVKHFYTNRSGANCCPDIYQCGAALAVTGRIRDIGQNVLQSSLGNGANTWHWTERFNLLLKQEAVAAPVTATFLYLSQSSWRHFLVEI